MTDGIRSNSTMASTTENKKEFRMKNILLGIMAILILSLLMFFIACDKDDEDSADAGDDDDDDDDNNDDSDGNPATECEDHTYPDILSITLIVNNEETEMPATVDVEDTLAIEFEYADPDCDFFGFLDDPYLRTFPFALEPQNLELTEYLDHRYFLEPDKMGCSSAEFGAPYHLDIDPVDYLLPPDLHREYPLDVILKDSCGLCNMDHAHLDFTVVAD